MQIRTDSVVNSCQGMEIFVLMVPELLPGKHTIPS